MVFSLFFVPLGVLAQSPTPCPLCFSGTPSAPNGTPPPPTATPPTWSDPAYTAPPTRIPAVDFSFTAEDVIVPPSISVPDMPSVDFSSESPPALRPIGVSVPVSLPDVSIITEPDSPVVKNLISVTHGLSQTISGYYSQTMVISGTIDSLMNGTDSLTGVITNTVPDWYAPDLPRDLAQVGWDFELMSSDVRRQYGVLDWFEYVAQLMSMPVLLAKSLAQIAALMGPFGLFLGWLFVMFVVVSVFRLIELLKNLLIRLINLIIQIWELIPGN